MGIELLQTRQNYFKKKKNVNFALQISIEMEVFCFTDWIPTFDRCIRGRPLEGGGAIEGHVPPIFSYLL